MTLALTLIWQPRVLSCQKSPLVVVATESLPLKRQAWVYKDGPVLSATGVNRLSPLGALVVAICFTSKSSVANTICGVKMGPEGQLK